MNSKEFLNKIRQLEEDIIYFENYQKCYYYNNMNYIYDRYINHQNLNNHIYNILCKTTSKVNEHFNDIMRFIDLCNNNDIIEQTDVNLFLEIKRKIKVYILWVRLTINYKIEEYVNFNNLIERDDNVFFLFQKLGEIENIYHTIYRNDYIMKGKNIGKIYNIIKENYDKITDYRDNLDRFGIYDASNEIKKNIFDYIFHNSEKKIYSKCEIPVIKIPIFYY